MGRRLLRGYLGAVSECNYLSPADLLAYLDELGIPHTTVDHAPVFTVAEAKLLRGSLPGGHSKSLFLKNKKGLMWLVVVAEDQTVDLDVLATSLGSKRLSFGSPDRLMSRLGVIPGAVTPFAAVNDREGVVTVAVSADLLANNQLNFHPLVNDRTTTIGSADLVSFLKAAGHAVRVLDDSEIH